MHLNDSVLLELLILAVLFGPLPVAYVTRSNDEPYVIFGFVVVCAVGYAILGFIGAWPLAVLIPAAWYFALKPIFKKAKSSAGR